MTTRSELQNFLRANKEAWQFATKATDDYLLARAGMRLGLWSSFEMGTQAIEKLLKSYLLFKEPSFGGDPKRAIAAVRKEAALLGARSDPHDVRACLVLAIRAGLGASADLENRVQRVNEYYTWRYPEASTPRRSMSTAEIDGIDEAVFEIWDAFEPLCDAYHACSGLMGPLYVAIAKEKQGGAVRLELEILRAGNHAFEARFARLDAAARGFHQAWYG